MSGIRRTAAHRSSPLDLGEFLEEHGDLDFEEEVDYRAHGAVPGSSGTGCESGVTSMTVGAAVTSRRTGRK